MQAEVIKESERRDEDDPFKMFIEQDEKIETEEKQVEVLSLNQSLYSALLFFAKAEAAFAKDNTNFVKCAKALVTRVSVARHNQGQLQGYCPRLR